MLRAIGALLALQVASAAAPKKTCQDKQYLSNPRCAAAPGADPYAAHECDHAQDARDCANVNGCVWHEGGELAPWHERNGVGNTCQALAGWGCGPDYFNTYAGTKVTSVEACCSCGGGSIKSATPAPTPGKHAALHRS